MAATITGTFRLPNGAPFVGPVSFAPVNGTLVPNAVIPGLPVTVQTDATGSFSQQMELGNYSVSVPGVVPFYISVPASGTHTINSRYESGLDWLIVQQGGGAAPIATPTFSGTVKIDVTSADPVVYIKGSVDALVAALQATDSNLQSQVTANATAATAPATPTGAGRVKTDALQADPVVYLKGSVDALLAPLQAGNSAKVGATPTATVGLTAKPGVLQTYLRSDGAPALDVAIVPTWTGKHTFNAGEALKVPAAAGAVTHVAAFELDPSGTARDVVCRPIAALRNDARPFLVTANLATTTVSAGNWVDIFGTERVWAGGSVQTPQTTGTYYLTLTGSNALAYVSVPFGSIPKASLFLARVVVGSGSVTVVQPDWTAGDMMGARNLSEVENVSTAQGNLGLGRLVALDSTISAAGSTGWSLGNTSSLGLLTQNVTAGGGAYTHVLFFPAATVFPNAGSRWFIRLDFAASANPTVELRNLTAAGTLLLSVKGLAAYATSVWAELLYDGAAGAWELAASGYVNGTQVPAVAAGGTPTHYPAFLADPNAAPRNVVSRTLAETKTDVAARGNPTALVGLTAKNGSADSLMRSDGAPALDQAIAPTWTGVHSFTAGLSTKIAMQIDSTVPMPYIAGFVADPTGTGAMLVARPGALVRNDVRPFSLNSQGITVTVSPGTRFLRDGTRVQLASATTAQVTSDGTFWVVHTAANAIVISPTLIQANPDDLVLGRVTRASGLINGLNMDDVLGGELVAGQNLADLTNPGTARTNIGLTRTVDTLATISAAGDTPWIVADNVANANATVQVDAPTTADGYLRTVTLQGDGTPNWITGAEATLTLNFAASSSGSARIEIRNMTAAGALLFAAAGHTGARAEVVRLVWNGTAWVSLTQGGVVPVALPGPTVSVVENALAGTPAGSIRWNGQNTKYAEAPIRGFPIGAGDYTVAVTVGLDVPGVGNGAIFALDGYPGGSLTPASAGGIYINVATGNYRLQYAVRNSSGSAVGSTSFDAAAYAGRVIQLALVRRAGVTDMFINGDLISISHPSTQAEPMVGDPLYLRIGAVGSGNASYPGRIFNARVFNRALTQANLKALAAFGVDSADRNAGGVFVSGALNNGDFEAWTTDGTAGSVNGSLPGWTIGAATGGCSVTRNVTDPIGGASSLLATTTIGNNIYWYPSNYAGVPQRRQRLSFKVQKLSGGSSPQIQITNTGVNTIITNLSLPTTAVVNYSVEYVCEGVAGQVRPALTHTSFQPAVTQVDDVVWESIGCLADIDCGVGLGYSLPDVQGRFPAQVIPSAYTDFVHSRPRREAQQIAYVATAGNIQIGALPANVRIRSIVADAASAVTLAVGTSSGGSQIVASVALVSGKQDLTIVGRFTSVPQQLWVNLSSAVAVILTVNFDLVS